MAMACNWFDSTGASGIPGKCVWAARLALQLWAAAKTLKKRGLARVGVGGGKGMRAERSRLASKLWASDSRQMI